MPRPIMYPPSSSEDDEENDSEINENEVEYDDENENTAPTPVDADASIVLSDIVRTGEASRLRRRGAMRLDHGIAGASSGIITVGRVLSPPSIYPWDPDAEADHTRDDTDRVRSSRGARLSQRRPHHPHCEEFPFTLFCGGYDDSDSEDMHGRTSYGSEMPYNSSILPLYPPSDTRHSSRPPIRKSNGCGALLHMHVAPRRRQGVWTSKTEATDAVISMDSVYFDRASVTKLVKSACGCVREGIGCAVCGNPLGNRYRPCKMAGDEVFAHSHHPTPGPFSPDGPRYWHAQSRPSSSASNIAIYTFFQTSVSSYPPYKFPPPPTRPVLAPHAQLEPRAPTHLESPQPTISPYQRLETAGVDPLRPPTSSERTTNTMALGYGSNMLFDRVMTSSPTPLSDVGEAEEDQDDRNPGEYLYLPLPVMGAYTNFMGARFDPDGEFIEREPSSPDKTGEVMLFPER